MSVPPKLARMISDIIVDDGITASIKLNMPREEYDSIRRMNASSLVAGIVDPHEEDASPVRDEFEATKIPPTRDEQDTYDKGTVTHLILLQPEQLPGRVAVWDGGTRHGGEWDGFCEANKGKVLIRRRDLRDVQTACRAYRSHSRISSLLRECDTEVGVFAKIEGIYSKGLIDAVTKTGPVTITDPKTSNIGVDSQSAWRAIRRFHYREKMGWYARLYREATGKEVEQVRLLFLSLPPERLGLRSVKLVTADLQWGEKRMLTVLRAVKECMETGKWPVFFADEISEGPRDYELDNDSNITFDGEAIE